MKSGILFVVIVERPPGETFQEGRDQILSSGGTSVIGTRSRQHSHFEFPSDDPSMPHDRLSGDSTATQAPGSIQKVEPPILDSNTPMVLWCRLWNHKVDLLFGVWDMGPSV